MMRRAAHVLPPATRLRLSHLRARVSRPRVALLRRGTPLSRSYGFDRGTPIDRYYIADFLSRHGGAAAYGAGDVRGDVMEVGGDEYATRFGGAAIRHLDVLHVTADNPRATMVGNLTEADGLPAERFDCIICTQTLQVIYEVRAAIATLHRMLRPGGVVLATVPGITPACRPDRDLWGDYWRFTSTSIRLLFAERFGASGVHVEAYGNVTAAASFLYGVAAEELRSDQLDSRDPDYEVLIAVRAQRAAAETG
jgi:SAM-dependent methyltransferase